MVIDASIGVKLVVPEEGTAQAVQLIDEHAISVPTLFHLEVGNAVWKKAQRREVELAPLLPFIGALANLVNTVSETPQVSRAVEIAAALHHPVYDCVYLALAEALEVPLVTGDKRFLNKIRETAFAKMVLPLGQLEAPDA